MRRSFTLCSIVVHAIAISAALIVQVLAVGPLPTPHRATLFEAASIMPADIRLPTPPRRAAVSPSRSAVSENAAPIVAPSGVIAEPEHEGVPQPVAGDATAGVTNGPPSAFEGVGVQAAIPPPPAPATPVHLHSGMRAPVKVVDVAPVYSTIAKSAHVQGVVILEAVLDRKGRVESVRVLRSIPLLDQAAVEAVQQWRYTPALLNGEPVPVVMTVTVNFTLQP
jgi:periplasmic protein TonB